MDSIEKHKQAKDTLKAIRAQLLNPDTRDQLLQELSKSQPNSGNTSQANQRAQTKGGKSFTISLPGRRGLLERDDNQKGFSRPIMLGLITLISETLFLIASYLLFK